MNNTKYYLSAIAAYATWGFMSLVLKPIHNYPSLDILFYRVFSCALLMLLITVCFKRKMLREAVVLFKSFPRKKKYHTILLHISSTIFLTANWFSFIYVINHINVKATSLAYLLCPILTTLLAFFILQEKLNKLQWLAIGLSIMGCLLFSYASISNMFYSMIIGFTYACYLVSQRTNTEFDKFIVLTFHIVLSALLLLLFYPAFSGPVPVSLKFYTFIEVVAVFFTIIPLFLNLYALKGLNSSTVGMLLNINPIIAFSLACLVYHEQIDQTQIIAYTIIFISVIIFNVHYLFKPREKELSASLP